MDSQNRLNLLDNIPLENSKVETWLTSTFPPPVEIQRLERNYKCGKCRLRFTNPTSLNYHEQSVHTECRQRFSCDGCEMSFTHEIVLEYHKDTMHNKHELCSICNKTFLKSLNHKHIQPNAQIHLCDVCKIYFTNRSDLTDHLLIHNSALYKGKEPSVQKEILTHLSKSLGSVLEGMGPNEVKRTSKSVGAVSNTESQHANECYRSRSGRIIKPKMCGDNCSFSPNPLKRSSSDTNNRNISLVSADGVPVSEDSGISSPSSNILLTSETIQSKKQKTCQEISPTKPSVAAAETIPDIDETVQNIDEIIPHIDLTIDAISISEPLDEPENVTINPPLDFENDIDSETINVLTSETPIIPQQESPISESPNISENDSLNIAINPSCDSGVFTMDMDSEASMSESPPVSSPLSKQFRRNGLHIYYCMRCKENNITDTKGHTCWKSRRKRQELLKPYYSKCSPCHKIFEKYDDVQQTFDNNQNLTSVINESPVPKLTTKTNQKRSSNKIECSKLMECIENEWSASLGISKGSKSLEQITLSTQSFQETIKESPCKESPVDNELKKLRDLQSSEKSEETEENPLYMDYSIKKDEKDIDYDLYYSGDLELMDCDICGLCVADLSWHKKQEHNFVIKKEPMDFDEMESVHEDPFAITQLPPSWIKVEPDSDDEYVEVFMILETSNESIMKNSDETSLIPYCFKLYDFITELNNHNKTCRRLFITCVDCKLVTYTEELFRKHELTGHELSEWWCDDCEKMFDKKSGLIDHLVNFDGEEWLCYECLACCIDKAHLIQHLKTHNVNIESSQCKRERHEIFCGDTKFCSFCQFCEYGSVSVAIQQLLSQIASHLFQCNSCFQAFEKLKVILCEPNSSICLIELE